MPSAESSRRLRNAPSVESREKLLVGLMSVLLVFVSWALGAYRTGAQIIYFTLSLAAFATLFIRAQDTRLPFKKLLHAPAFYIAGTFLLYLIIGALNPSLQLIGENYPWPMRMLDYTDWLPMSVDSSFHPMSPWKVIVWYTAIFFAVCAAWVGITRRRSLLFLVWVFTLNGLLISAVAIAQRLTLSMEFLWLFKPTEYKWDSFASFVYKNHTAVYLSLVLAACLGLFLYYQSKAKAQLKSGGIHFLLGPAAFLPILAILLSWSRGGMLCALIILVAFALSLILFWSQFYARSKILIVTLLLSLAAAGLTWITLDESFTAALVDRFEDLDDEFESESLRSKARSTTWTMFSDMPLYGWGPGSFRYVFRHYQRSSGDDQLIWFRKDKMYYRFHEAHNDYVQSLAEYGIVGCSLLAALAILLLVQIYRYRASLWGLSGMIYAATLALAANAFFDFPLQNPTITITLGILLILAYKYQQLSLRRSVK